MKNRINTVLNNRKTELCRWNFYFIVKAIAKLPRWLKLCRCFAFTSFTSTYVGMYLYNRERGDGGRKSAGCCSTAVCSVLYCSPRFQRRLPQRYGNRANAVKTSGGIADMLHERHAVIHLPLSRVSAAIFSSLLYLRARILRLSYNETCELFCTCNNLTYGESCQIIVFRNSLLTFFFIFMVQ
jgi:hypothetical protein